MKINLCFKIKFILEFNANELAPFCHKVSLGWWNLHIWNDTIPHNVTNEWSTQQMLKPASVLYEHISVWSLWVLIRELRTKLILTVELNNTCPPLPHTHHSFHFARPTSRLATQSAASQRTKALSYQEHYSKLLQPCTDTVLKSRRWRTSAATESTNLSRQPNLWNGNASRNTIVSGECTRPHFREKHAMLSKT
jgi:hypothetical protein